MHRLLISLTIILLSVPCLGQYSGGSGTVGEPYRIGTAGDLVLLGNSDGDWDKHYALTADINLAGYTFGGAVIAPDRNPHIGHQGQRFEGSFNGGGHVIRNLTINLPEADYVGLFGYIGTGGEIRNLGLKWGSVLGRDDVGVLIGCNEGTVTNCYSTGSVSGHVHVGGLMGVDRGTVTNCYSTGSVGGDDALGGLVGLNYEGTITSCYSTVSVSGDDVVGGLVGSVYRGTITNCYSTGLVSGDGRVGGLLGYNYYGSITDCYSTGSVNGNDAVGGLVGTNLGTITRCYFLETSGVNNGNGEALSEEAMRLRASFVGWDFVGENGDRSYDAWKMIEGVTMPLLLWDKRLVHLIRLEGGEEPGEDVMRFCNTSEEEVSWYIDSQNLPDWLGVLSVSGTIAAGSCEDVPVSFDTGELAVGIYRHLVDVYDSRTMEVIDVTGVLVEVIGPIIAMSQEEFMFSASEDGGAPAAQKLIVSNVGGGELDWVIEPDYPCEWLIVEPVSGILGSSESEELTVSVNATGLGTGVYSCNLAVSDPYAENDPQVVEVTLRVLSAEGVWVPHVYPTIQGAIDAAIDGEKIVVGPGVYSENIDFKGKNITLQSVGPDDWRVVGATEIFGGYDGPTVTFSGSEGAGCLLQGFTITGGSTASYDGGICGNGTGATVRNCYVRNNESAQDGGGIYDFDGLIENCVIANNYAQDDGGGLAFCDGVIRNCTIAENRALDEGSGLYDCDALVENCVIWENSWGTGQVYGGSTPHYSCIQDWSGEGEGNISSDPFFSTTGYWTPDPNDPSREIWVRDYHLKSEAGRWDPVGRAWVYDDVTSPCIDAGSPGFQLGDEFGEESNVRINMGAYGGTAEASRTPAGWGILSDMSNDRSVGMADFGIAAELFGLVGERLAGDLDRDGLVGLGDLAVLIEEWVGP